MCRPLFMSKLQRSTLKEIAERELEAIGAAGAEMVRSLIHTSISRSLVHEDQDVTVNAHAFWENQKDPAYRDRLVRVLVNVSDTSFLRQFIPITVDGIYDFQTNTWKNGEK